MKVEVRTRTHVDAKGKQQYYIIVGEKDEYWITVGKKTYEETEKQISLAMEESIREANELK